MCRITNGTYRLNESVPLFLLPPPLPQLHRYALQTVPTRTAPPNAAPTSEYTPADLKILDSLLGSVLIEIRNYGPHSGAHKLIIIPWPSSIHSPECMDTNMAEGNEWIRSRGSSYTNGYRLVDKQRQQQSRKRPYNHVQTWAAGSVLETLVEAIQRHETFFL
ncbi:hypothetical protein C8R44DRAFT_740617 [Mycena epipterygia]|nr:hypothetical protein C8R44DRAFT_740617 [Mycena epipterygia]